MIPWSSPFIWTRCVDSLLNLRRPEGIDVIFIRGTGWSPARRHTDAVEKALDQKAELLLFFGADQIAPPYLLERLCHRFFEGYAVINALVPSRGYFSNNVHTKPFQPLAWRWKSTPLSEEGRFVFRPYRNQKLDGDMLEVVIPDGKVQPVHIIGSGCMIFHRDHITSLKRPWFQEAVDPLTYKRFANMDTRFSSRLIHEAGVLMWVDTSIKILHLTDMAIDTTFQDRFNDWMDPSIVNSESEIIQVERTK